MALNQWIGLVVASIGLIFIAIGVFGIYMYENFYTKASASSLIDSVGFILVSAGIVIYMGLSYFSLKSLFLIVLILLLNPLANHYIVRGAHRSGYQPGKEQ